MSKQQIIKPKWQKRFDFFDQYGTKFTSSEYKTALNNLPFMEKVNIRTNFLGLLFGWIYLFILGVWRKNISLILLMISSGVIFYIVAGQFTSIPENTLNLCFNLVWMAIYGSWTNRIYYLDVVKGSKSWNPFE